MKSLEKKEVKNIKKKVNCNRSPTAKVYMFVKKKTNANYIYIFKTKHYFFSFAFYSRVCAHIQNIMQENVYFSIPEM